MHNISGLLIPVTDGDEAQLGRYIDVDEIQRPNEKFHFDLIVFSNKADKIASRTLLAPESATVINDGTVDLKFYLARTEASPAVTFVFVPAGQTMTFPASDLGNPDFRYLMVWNQSLTTNGHYVLTMTH